MAKTKFFRVAVEGMTASDGRTIEKQWLLDIEATYNPQTFGARVNMEHIRGYSAEGPFIAYGDVLAVKTQLDDIEIAGKTEKRLALYAQLDPTDQLVKYNQARQKIYTSIEVEPNFSGSGKAYLMGLAVTDSPASLGTDALAFSANGTDAFAKTLKGVLDSRKQHATCLFSALTETAIEVETDASADAGGDTPLDKVMAAFAKILNPAKEEPKTPPVQQLSQDQTGAGNAALMTAFADLGKGLAETLKADRQAAEARFAKLTSELAAVRQDIETTPANNHSQRPANPGAASGCWRG
ncbi:MAG: phage capsid protein, partial [Caulobacteraceae bacterium]|nr:phage capsid protein [Caulobacteraceae bacterium]